MKHRLVYCFLVIAAWMGSSPLQAEQARPNFLVVVVDDLSPRHFSCYDSKAQPTPHIDALAETGVMFRTAWATPMCSSSRALLTTGRYPFRTGVWHNDLRINEKRSDRYNWTTRHLTFAQALRDNGYRTVLVGNNMALGGQVDESVGFDEFCHRADQPSAIPAGEVFTGLYEGKYNFPNAPLIPSRYWHPCVIENGRLKDTGPEDFGPDIFTDYLVNFIKREHDAPFLAYYPLNLVHDIAGGGLPTMPFRGRPGTNKGGSLEDMFRYIDATIGRLVAALEEAGQRDHTVIIFTSDNGDSKNGMKMHATEDGPRVPLVINGPGLVKPLGSSGALVEFSDIFPTLIDYSGAGLPNGHALDGKSLRPFLTGESATHREWIMSYIATARMARTKDWILEAVDPFYGSGSGRLYRTKGDYRRSNYVLVGEAQTTEERAAHAKLMQILETNPWPDRDDPKVAAELRSYDRMPYKHFLDTGKLVQKIYTD
ncbi:MAG: sulfatase-like hydrolase/transferase [Verrucomicrobia bacterium]|nr:sulfatase-like hydrolase/transferase [Verrucomicrobiota bacterium]